MSESLEVSGYIASKVTDRGIESPKTLIFCVGQDNRRLLGRVSSCCSAIYRDSGGAFLNNFESEATLWMSRKRLRD